MTIQEAIEDLKEIFSEHELDLPWQDTLKVLNIAIKCMEEVEQYRALGTVEELKKALEKQVAKKPIEKEFYNMPHCSCPICESGLYYEQEYCDECGQALKWGEEDV